MAQAKYKRVLLKLSGEFMAGEFGVWRRPGGRGRGRGADQGRVYQMGVQMAIVIGGGNIWRGAPA